MTWRILVAAALLAVVGLFWFGLGRNPREIPSPLVGKDAPVWRGAMLTGEPFGSEQIKGKVALVSFWATWCTTCKADEPLIDSLQAEFGGDPDFVLVGIATQDSEEKVTKYLKSHRKYTNLYDGKGRLAIDFGVYGVPETYLISKEGKIIQKIAGPINQPALAAKIRELLQKGKAG